jgi:hypothetical protein
MKWNQEIFKNNLEALIEAKYGGVQNKFNETMGRDAATRWKTARPSFPLLLKITELFGCGFDWLLTEHGHVKISEPQSTDSTCAPDCPLHDCDKPIKDLCEKVKVLVESETHWGESLKSNINSFKKGYDKDLSDEADKKRMDELIKNNNVLAKNVKRLEKTVEDMKNHSTHFAEAAIAPPTGTDAGDGTER